MRHRHKPQCKEHYQGDRCWKSAGHASSVALKPDEVHAGTHNAWSGEGDGKKLVAREFVSKTPKRNRRLNRFIRAFGPIGHSEEGWRGRIG